MSIIRFLLIFIIVTIPFGAHAQSGLLDPNATLAELQLLIAQYEARLKKVESENAILRYQMAQAGIQIPLGDFSGTTTIVIPTALTGSSVISNTGVSAPQSSTLSDITAKYGKDVAGFISQINKDWSAIRTNYKFPAVTKLAGYEFVQSGNMDHVFVDIVIGTGVTGVYDIKVLYQFDKSTYKRKLIGIFDYNNSTSRYITRSGTNPFGWVARTFIKDPYYLGSAETPTTALVPVSSWSTTSTTNTWVTPSPIINTATGSSSVTLSEITKAYNEKRYLSTISLSNSYLASNPATQEILNIRYRTFFIIGKYAESLAELSKIEKIATIDKQTACNAQVIATYSKNQSLVDKYTAICKK